ncbi:hypothetical protein [Streptomyces beijiangensis]|uniref:hypothetical protein n=1 Tax=Streptomyces beijiangensis TaxID=163361 RepID=UPI001F5CF875|nr:hypothetical protein [Streptomyces beijiangensis]
MTTLPVSWLQRASWSAAGLTGAACGYGAIALAAHARAYCGAGADAGGNLELNLLILPFIALFSLGAVSVAAVARRATLRRPRTVRAAVQLVAVLGILSALTVWFFAARGTLDGYPGDTGLCPASNIPPWWPRWLPA